MDRMFKLIGGPGEHAFTSIVVFLTPGRQLFFLLGNFIFVQTAPEYSHWVNHIKMHSDKVLM